MKRKKSNLKKKILKSCTALLLVIAMAVQGPVGASAASLAESSETAGTTGGIGFHHAV